MPEGNPLHNTGWEVMTKEERAQRRCIRRILRKLNEEKK